MAQQPNGATVQQRNGSTAQRFNAAPVRSSSILPILVIHFTLVVNQDPRTRRRSRQDVGLNGTGETVFHTEPQSVRDGICVCQRTLPPACPRSPRIFDDNPPGWDLTSLRRVCKSTVPASQNNPRRTRRESGSDPNRQRISVSGRPQQGVSNGARAAPGLNKAAWKCRRIRRP